MLTLENGVSRRALAFEPGIQVGDEVVSKTFQPSYVITETGALLVFCQGRLRGGGDDAPKVVLMNRSNDRGETWEGARAITPPLHHYAVTAYASPRGDGERISFLTPVGLSLTKDYYGEDEDVIREKAGIDLDAVGRHTTSVLCRFYSDDDGKTWQQEVLSGDKSPLNTTFGEMVPVFFNPIGQGHTIEAGPYKGRKIIAGPVRACPAGKTTSDDFRAYKGVGSGVIYSDDGGETWQMGGISADYLGNEASAASIRGGEELLMIRRLMAYEVQDRHPPKFDISPQRDERVANISRDGGATWSDPFLLKISSITCHGTLTRLGNRLYFSIPDVVGQPPCEQSGADRKWGTIYFSDDDGAHWSRARIEEGLFSYSTVGALTEEVRITFYARGVHGDQGIGYRLFTDEWLDRTAVSAGSAKG